MIFFIIILLAEFDALIVRHTFTIKSVNVHVLLMYNNSQLIFVKCYLMKSDTD
jgi:hypothetical protein